MKNKNWVLLTFLIVIAAYGCAKLRSAGYNDYFKQKWMLTYVQGYEDAVVIKSKGYIDFTKAPGTNQGGAFAGCNRMFFTYETTAGNALNIRDIGSTKMMCEGIDLENGFARHLEQVTSFEIKGHILLLKDASGNVLIKARDLNWK